MARRGVIKNEVFADFSELINHIGAAQAMNESIEDPQYIDAVMRAAHGTAEQTFNAEAAAMGATGAIRHMFEWGTAGINRGRTNVRPNPMSERARLWYTTLIGSGHRLQMNYVFKPSVAIVPKPTVRDTGMSREVIEQMRDHVFTWKAQVMELGTEVTIAPQEAEWLLIPKYDGAEAWFRANDLKRGYTLSKGPLTATPGAKVAGNFTSFWMGFWEGQGKGLMDKHMDTQIKADFTADVTKPVKTGVKPVKAGSITSQVKSRKTKVKAKAKTKARARRRTP